MAEPTDPGPLRPARPRRRTTAATEPAPAPSPELLARVDELQEVLWAVVDTLDGMGRKLDDLARELQAMRAEAAAPPAAPKRATAKKAAAGTATKAAPRTRRSAGS